MRYRQIRQYDVANGPGIRTTVFVSGCSRRCFNCFNEAYQDFQAGEEWSDEETARIIGWLQAGTNSGLTLLGGEPMESAADLQQILRIVRGAVPKVNVWVYSGYVYEEIQERPVMKALLDLCDVLVDGPFVDELKDPGLYFRGSSNQRIIDIAESRKAGKAVLLWPDGR